jgi:hypothetical protein
MLAMTDPRSAIASVERELEGVLREIERIRTVRRRHQQALAAVGGSLALLFGSAGILATAAPSGETTVVEPFKVVDAANHAIFSVWEDEEAAVLDLFDKSGGTVVQFAASDSDSYIRASTPDDSLDAILGVENSTPYFKLTSGGSSGAAATLADRISFDVTGGKPFVRLKVGTGHGVLQLGQGASGGGELLIAKPGGDVVVNAGVSAQSVGRVEALPLGNPLGSEIVGIPR